MPNMTKTAINILAAFLLESSCVSALDWAPPCRGLWPASKEEMHFIKTLGIKVWTKQWIGTYFIECFIGKKFRKKVYGKELAEVVVDPGFPKRRGANLLFDNSPYPGKLHENEEILKERFSYDPLDPPFEFFLFIYFHWIRWIHWILQS